MKTNVLGKLSLSAILAASFLMPVVACANRNEKKPPAAVGSAEEDAIEKKLMGDGLDALYTRKDYPAAISIFRSVLARNPVHYGANFQIAYALDAAGRHPEAVPYWKEVLRIARAIGDKPTADTAMQRLGADAPAK